MDLVNSFVQFKQASNMAAVQYAVAAKILNSQKQAGAGVIKMIEAAGNVAVSAGNQAAAAASGIGDSVDTYG